MNERVSVLVIVLALFMALAVPAGAVERPAPKLDVAASMVSPLEVNPVRVSLGRYVYFKFNKWEVRRIAYRLGAWSGAWAAASAMCAFLTFIILKAICVAAFKYLGWDIYTTFKAAARRGQCVQAVLGYSAWVWNRWPRPYDLQRYSC